MEKFKYFIKDNLGVVCIFIIIIIVILFINRKFNKEDKNTTEDISTSVSSSQIDYYEEDNFDGDIWTIKNEEVNDIFVIQDENHVTNY